ncbi:hypothetical protein INR49_013215 [Caranx melampygus]|nr:hypothetical protein INR49_013215 [Caranx melampygus]
MKKWSRVLEMKPVFTLNWFVENRKCPHETLHTHVNDPACFITGGRTDALRLFAKCTLEQKQVVPPFKPNISGEFGLDNFDAQFTNEPIQLTPDDDDVVKKIDQSEFEGFEYINPLLMSAEECRLCHSFKGAIHSSRRELFSPYKDVCSSGV